MRNAWRKGSAFSAKTTSPQKPLKNGAIFAHENIKHPVEKELYIVMSLETIVINLHLEALQKKGYKAWPRDNVKIDYINGQKELAVLQRHHLTRKNGDIQYGACRQHTRRIMA